MTETQWENIRVMNNVSIPEIVTGEVKYTTETWRKKNWLNIHKCVRYKGQLWGGLIRGGGQELWGVTLLCWENGMDTGSTL